MDSKYSLRRSKSAPRGKCVEGEHRWSNTSHVYRRRLTVAECELCGLSLQDAQDACARELEEILADALRSAGLAAGRVFVGAVRRRRGSCVAENRAGCQAHHTGRGR